MTVYRLTFEIDSARPIPTRTLVNLWTETHKYLRTVLLPIGSADQVKFQIAEVPDFRTLDADSYPVHHHRGQNGCDVCSTMYSDNHGD